ncbi:MAG: bifunctional glutamate N-acetyltransferase/amino-acid acetyltransferase ArgJ [Oscillospiraceae bacterium]|jgi:glutamate N-acetyltransferase/amino-acid N-acetyltransferase|nr:bifunctional glutamate N-acetyltransferase/amino-acid acetyltransferase ArgJ [Oscillospiraceae bacterium]
MITFDDLTPVYGGVCAAKGFTAGSVRAGIKAGSEKDDLAMIYCVKPCPAAAVYTRNIVKGAPIVLTQRHLKDGKAQAVIVNSGNANTCNANGMEIAELMCELTADCMKIKKENVIVASTGVIGQQLSPEPFEKYIPVLAGELNEVGSTDACKAIMTTDTRVKEFAFEFTLPSENVTCAIGGISKGSGMINPDMATLLAFITTDAAISLPMLQRALSDANEISYSRVNIDGDTSTNDMAAIMASGLAENELITEENEDYEAFFNALCAVMLNLARETARDGEGATKLIECAVMNAPSEEDAALISRAVISSNLVKAAIFAADANWGRILCAAGYSGAEFDPDKVSVKIISENGEVIVCENGCGTDFVDSEAHNVLLADEITIIIDLHEEGAELNQSIAWGCDLTYDYVKINAEYRT